MFREKIHVIIPIAAALIVSVLNFFSGSDFYVQSIRLIITITAFYVVGLIVKYVLNNIVFPSPEKAKNAESDVVDRSRDEKR